VRHFLLPLALILAVSALLIASDGSGRSRQLQREDAGLPRIAIVQHVAQAAIDEGVDGVIAALAARGYEDGRTAKLTRFNAQGDIATANDIAVRAVDGSFDLVISASTVSMQAVANANRAGRTRHIFGVVADPASAGVGISRENPLDHPAHMAGIGSFMSVEKVLGLAREMNPGLKRLGLVWHTSETNSRAYTEATRKACTKLGIELFEANAETSSAVGEAAASLVPKNLDAFLVTPDVMVLVAVDAIVAVADRARIPVISVVPPNVRRGALFDLGLDYHTIGFDTGMLAADVLDGLDPAGVPVTNLVPEQLNLNLKQLAAFKERWRLPAGLEARARVVVTQDGERANPDARYAPAPAVIADPLAPHAVADREYRMGLAYFAPEQGAETTMRGLFEGLSSLGYVESRNLEIRRAHAQGEIANIPVILQNFDGQADLDLIMTMTTPCLAGACAIVRNRPLVFMYVFDPIAAGAGRSATDHLPGVTGIGSFPPIEETESLLRQVFPTLRAVGSVYNNAEANSVKVVGVQRELLAKHGIRLEEVTVSATNEILQATQSLAQRDVDVIWVAGDNTVGQGFDALLKGARDANLPVITNDTEYVERGALMGVGISWFETGQAASRVVARVLSGQKTASIPLQQVAVKQVIVNDAEAARFKVRFPPELAASAAHVTTVTAPEVP
jgi:ABC-type uncharacterized transport system substrate-binding protein